MATTQAHAPNLGALPIRAVGVDAASRMYGLGKTTLRDAIRNGSLRSYRVGRRVLLKLTDLDSWLERGAK